ncbi:MAG: hypothetical protein CFE40_08010 [Burkholderiales bacterium PBB1]|nr:MAG: hypothetical protein CFE40_08010 [Burkholderiales bacterium PBB1]
MNKNLLVAALLSTMAAVSFAQPPVDKHDKAMSEAPKHEKSMHDAPKHEKAMSEEPKHEKTMKGAEKHSQKQHNKKSSDSTDGK